MEKHVCKYCGKELEKVLIPPESKWGVEYFLVCMNDKCSYYTRGWEWMKNRYEVHASYRYRLDPDTSIDGPIPVKSPDDMKEWVVHQFDR